MIRTRFAPSPTGYLHIGGARTALFSWAYARRHGGQFVLRIEDTDRERSTEQSVQAILDGMRWLNLDWDEGPIRQTDRMARYREVADELLRTGHAYPCYCSREELEQMREAQKARGDKPRYDGRWRPENARRGGLAPPPGVQPVLRFRNPDSGEVVFHDEIKGDIRFANEELDDLVILRADGMPTYNFGVVVDDLDMRITHVIRGDDHVNNTPRQVNIMRALGADLPAFAHVPMILGADGERLSKRHGAVSVMQYAEDGFLPEALLNYLARLGWSHGDAEIFSAAQLVEWFDLRHVSRSPARFDPEKFRWLNHQYLKGAADERLAELVRGRLGVSEAGLADGPPLEAVVALLKERAETLPALAEDAKIFYHSGPPAEALLAEHLGGEARALIGDFAGELSGLAGWDEAGIAQAVKATLARRGVKMPKLAMPVRVAVFGTPRTPDLARVLAVAGRERVLARLGAYAE